MESGKRLNTADDCFFFSGRCERLQNRASSSAYTMNRTPNLHLNLWIIYREQNVFDRAHQPRPTKQKVARMFQLKKWAYRGRLGLIKICPALFALAIYGNVNKRIVIRVPKNSDANILKSVDRNWFFFREPFFSLSIHNAHNYYGMSPHSHVTLKSTDCAKWRNTIHNNIHVEYL